MTPNHIPVKELKTDKEPDAGERKFQKIFDGLLEGICFFGRIIYYLPSGYDDHSNPIRIHAINEEGKAIFQIQNET